MAVQLPVLARRGLDMECGAQRTFPDIRAILIFDCTKITMMVFQPLVRY